MEAQMRRRFVAAAAMTVLLPCLAFAQGHGDREEGQQTQAQEQALGHPGEAQKLRLAQNDERREERRDERRKEQEERREQQQERRGERREQQQERREERRDVERERNRPVFTFQGREYTALRAPEYRYPRGWAYRAWRPGQVLPRLFIAEPYFLDYAYLGLPPPPPGTRWVRYGPDALLVDFYSGRVVDVIYSAFY
jgi:Ni/Co efflux regulator RcnB